MAERSDGKVVIEITGDASELVKALKEVTAAARDGLSGAMQDVAVSVRDATAASDALTGASGGAAQATGEMADAGREGAEALQDAARAAEKAEGELKDTADAAGDAEGGLADTADAAGEAENGLKDAAKAADKAEDELDDLGDGLEDVGDEFEGAGKKALSFGDILKANVFGSIITGALKALKNSLGEIGKALITNAAEHAASIAAYEQIMGDYVDTADRKLQQLSDDTGIYVGLLRGNFSQATAKFKGLGYEVADATDLASRATLLAADAAALCDTAFEDAAGSLNSFINGSYQGGEAILLFANDTQMAQYAVERGLVATTAEWSKLDEATKQATRLEYAENLYRQSGAMGQAAREADGWATVTNNLRGVWGDFLAQVGTPLLKALTPVLQSVTEKLKEITERINWEKFSEVVSGILNFLIDNYKAVGVALLAIAGGFMAISIASSPLTLLVAAVVAIIAVITLLWTKCEGFRNFILGVAEVFKELGKGFKDIAVGVRDAVVAAIDGIKRAVEAIVNFFRGIVQTVRILGEGFKEVAVGIKNAFVAAWNGIKSAWAGVAGFFRNVWQQIKNVFSNVWETFLQIGKNLINGLKDGILAGIRAVVDAARSVVNAVKSVFTGKQGLDIHSPSKTAERYGKAVDDGLAKGIRKNAPAPAKAAKEAVFGVSGSLSQLNTEVWAAGKQTAAAAQASAQSVQTAARTTAAAVAGAARTVKDTVTDTEKKIEDESAKWMSAYNQTTQKGIQGIVDDYESAAEDIRQQQAALAARLGETGDLFIQTVTGSSLGQYGGMDALLKDLDLYDAWEEAFQELKDRGVPDSFLADWLETDMATAVEYAQKMLQLPPGQFDEYLALSERRKEAAADAADAVGAEQARFTTLADLQGDIDRINAYGDAMARLRERGASEELLTEVRDMDREAATAYADALLALSDEAWDEYLAAYTAKGEAARRVAEEVFGPEVQALEDEFLATLPDKLESVGNDAMDTLAEAILGEGQLAIEATAWVADAIIAEMERINFTDRLQTAAGENIAAMSASLASSAGNSKEAADAASQAAATRQAAAYGVVSAGNVGGQELVMKIDGTTFGRVTLPYNRAADEQSPKVVSD